MIKVEVPEKKLGYRVADIGPGGKEYNVKTYGSMNKEALDPVGQEDDDIDNDVLVEIREKREAFIQAKSEMILAMRPFTWANNYLLFVAENLYQKIIKSRSYIGNFTIKCCSRFLYSK